MSLLILDMPEEPNRVREWLEQQLVGLELPRLVEELLVVHGEPADAPTLEDVFGDSLSDVSDSGLASTTESQLQTLLTHPRLLLELQDHVTHEGGDYWLHVPISDERREAVDRGWERLKSEFQRGGAGFRPESGAGNPAAGSETPEADSETPADRSESTEAGAGRPADDHRRGQATDPWGYPAATGRRSVLRWFLAACGLLLAVGIGTLLLRQPSGWNRPARLTADRSPEEVFVALAEASESYIEAPRDSSRQLGNEIERFIRDCQQVQQLQLPELAAIQHPEHDTPDSNIATYADWLRVKCKAWEVKATDVLASLRDGSIDPDTADERYSGILTKLKTALQKQADSLA